MTRLKRLLRIAAAVLGALLYVWFAAVRHAGAARRRRAARRAARVRKPA